MATAGFEEEQSAYRYFAEFCNRIGMLSINEKDTGQNSRPVYLSKALLPSGVSRFVNEDEVSGILEKQGMDVIYPERLSLAEQIRLFTNRRLFVGTVGSGFHTALFSWTRPIIIGIHHENSIVTNFTLSDEINGIDARYFYPKNGVTNVGPNGNFTRNVKFDSPGDVARDILNIVPKIT